MRTILIAAALLAGGAAFAPASAESVPFRHYPWCLDYSGDDSFTTNCGFSTYQQCRATASGAGGFCYENPWYYAAMPRGDEPPPPRKKRYVR